MTPAGAVAAETEGDALLRWADAVRAAAVLAVDPAGVGGVWLRARFGPTRAAWLAGLDRLLGAPTGPRIAPDADDARLFGGLDLAATLSAGRPIQMAGVLAAADGGVVTLAMAERMADRLAGRIAAVMDTGQLPRAAATKDRTHCRLGLVALDEGAGPDERAPSALTERLAIHLVLAELPRAEHRADWPLDGAAVADARARLPSVSVDDETLDAVCRTAAALGIVSLRAPAQALAVARAAAALDGRDAVEADDIELAARLVLGPRATAVPAAEPSEDDESDAPSEPGTPATPATPAAGEDKADQHGDEDPSSAPDETTSDEANDAEREPAEPSAEEIDPTTLDEQAVAAAAARLPAGLLDEAGHTSATATRRAAAGRAGVPVASARRGRPVGVRPGRPDDRHRLDVIATLRAAAPWQRLRGRSAEAPRLRLRRDDFRVTCYQQPRETATIFVVDVSGSAALHRLHEAKGAVELLLADCYIRRDRVGLVAFRGRAAETPLAPTRSLVAARRRLAGLVGGGPTPLAAGIDAALAEAERAARDGATPTLVFLTDGRGNVARDGVTERGAARRDAQAAAARLAQAGHAALVIDISPRPRPAARELAEAMNARYIGLPAADAERLSNAVRAETA